MSTNGWLTTLAAHFATATGIAGASAVELDTVPDSPYVILLAHRGRAVPGSWDQLYFSVPARCYVLRSADESITRTAINDAFDAIVAALRTGITLGGAVVQATIASWDTSHYYEVGTSQYAAIDFELLVPVFAGETYTA